MRNCPGLLLLLVNIFLFCSDIKAVPRINGFNSFNIALLDSDTTDPVDKKVIISAGNNNLELTPQSSFNNGLLIQPVNSVSNTSFPVAFYTADTSSWSFYTNGEKRLSVTGLGNITSTVPLLIRYNGQDSVSALRVNGNARVDSSIIVQADSDTESYISMNRTTKSTYLDQDDGFSPYTTTPTQWASASNVNIPSLRIRHPLNTSNIQDNNKSIQRDFLIAPYQYGMAIEYNGVVECWVGEWSIHKGVKYYDTEGQGNGWGAVLWVGDDVDRGGIRATARNNTLAGGNVAYGEIAVEKFHNGGSNGDLRLRLPSTENQFHFVYGEKGTTNIVAKISDKGFFIPVVSSPAAITTPEKGQVYFDSTAAEFKGYDGNEWVNLSNKLITGSTVLSSNGTSTFYQITHGLGATPFYYNVIATSENAAGINYIKADATNINVYYNTAPPSGINNLSWNWQIKR